MTERSDLERVLRDALDPIRSPGPLPAAVLNRSRRRRFVYGASVALAACLAVGLAVALDPLGSPRIDPADAARVVPYERLPISEEQPDQDDHPALTADQQLLEPVYSEIPLAVATGDDIHFVIELRNPTDEDISLDPCPTFVSAWGDDGTAYFESGYLNCDEAPPGVPARGSLRFEMVLPLPAEPEISIAPLSWRLEGSNASSAEARVESIVRSETIAVSRGACLEPTQDGRSVNRCKTSGPRRPCPGAIEHEGLAVFRRFPPRPFFEGFNMWSAKQRKGGCVQVVAGQQVAEEDASGAPVYEPNGWLLILGDLDDRDGVAKVEVPLPRPIRIVHALGRGARADLTLQSLSDCSTITFGTRTRTFTQNPDPPELPCPDR